MAFKLLEMLDDFKRFVTQHYAQQALKFPSTLSVNSFLLIQSEVINNP